ncbi:hypothetical protein LguiB_006304 [Lonicera macranthoides]
MAPLIPGTILYIFANGMELHAVNCKRHDRVTILNLTSKGLVGSLSPYIGNTSFLKIVWLLNNTLGGEISPQVSRLFRLQELHLGGEIPNSIGNLTSLEIFSATHNQLVGNLPNALGKLKNPRQLTLGRNQLSGVIPPSIYNLSLINHISIPYNQLHDTLSPEFGIVFPNLEYLQLGGNQFTGPLPFSFSNATKLIRIDIPLNNFTGKISVDFGRLQNLMGLSLGGNNLGSGEPDEMSFISSLGNCTNLQVLELGDNQLEGAILYKIGNFSTQLFYFSILNNHVYGSIPLWICDLVGELINLSIFDAFENKLSGEIPKSLGSCTKLENIYLDNFFQGLIPPSLSSLKGIQVVDFSSDTLSGQIPKFLEKFSLMNLNLS